MALSTIDAPLKITAGGDTAAGDDAAIGVTAAEGLILTGQGSTADITIKNDADTLVASVATGTTVMNFASAITVGGSALSNTATNAAVTGTVVKGTTSLQTPLIEFTDGDDAMSIADGGVVTFSQPPVFDNGTWTLAMFDASSGGNTAVGTTSVGTYSRIGKIVVASFYIINQNNTGLTGSNIAHWSLPFPAAPNAPGVGIAHCNILGASSDVHPALVISPDGNRAYLVENVDNDNRYYFTVANISDDTFDMMATITYITDAS